jgi:hypothetical protein
MKAGPHPDVLSGGVLFALAAGYGSFALRIPAAAREPGPRFVPIGLAIVLAVMALRILVSGLRASRATGDPSAESATASDRVTAASWRRPGLAAAMTVLYAAALQPLGFAPSTLAYVAGVTALFSAERWLLIVVPLLVTSALYLFFDVALGVRLP